MVVDVRFEDLELEALLRPLTDEPVGESTPEWRKVDWAVPQRVIIIENWVYSITHSGVAVHELDLWERERFLEYPGR